MVVRQLPKLFTRVRFPSPALNRLGYRPLETDSIPPRNAWCTTRFAENSSRLSLITRLGKNVGSFFHSRVISDSRGFLITFANRVTPPRNASEDDPRLRFGLYGGVETASWPQRLRGCG